MALIAPHHLSHCRRILRGIAGHARRRGWHLLVVAPGRGASGAIRAGGADGAIVHLDDPAKARPLVRLGLPLVGVSGLLPDGVMPRVGVDDRAVGACAAEHLADLGHRAFAFLGHGRHPAALTRESGWNAALAARGLTGITLRLAPTGRMDAAVADLPVDGPAIRWLADLAPGSALGCFNDIIARQAVELLRRAGRRVPEDVAVVGVDDDDLLCNLSSPALSSVALPSEAIGWRAAELLETLMDGAAPPAGPVLLPPVGVAARRSSDRLADIDPHVATALACIRDGLARPLSVARIAGLAGIARRGLERRFEAALGRGIATEVRRQRIELARRMLAEGDQPLAAIAAACGLREAKRLCTVFRQATGMTPEGYRRLVRPGWTGISNPTG